ARTRLRWRFTPAVFVGASGRLVGRSDSLTRASGPSIRCRRLSGGTCTTRPCTTCGAGEARLAVGHLLQPPIEAGNQVDFARTPPVTRDEHVILESIDWIAHGFEIVQCPFPDWEFAAVDTIAACGVHGALVIGTPVPVSEIENCVDKLRRFEVVLSRDGA